MDIPTYDFVTAARCDECTHVDTANVILFDGILAFYDPEVRIRLTVRLLCLHPHRARMSCHDLIMIYICGSIAVVQTKEPMKKHKSCCFSFTAALLRVNLVPHAHGSGCIKLSCCASAQKACFFTPIQQEHSLES